MRRAAERALFGATAGLIVYRLGGIPLGVPRAGAGTALLAITGAALVASLVVATRRRGTGGPATWIAAAIGGLAAVGGAFAYAPPTALLPLHTVELPGLRVDLPAGVAVSGSHEAGRAHVALASHDLDISVSWMPVGALEQVGARQIVDDIAAAADPAWGLRRAGDVVEAPRPVGHVTAWVVELAGDDVSGYATLFNCDDRVVAIVLIAAPAGAARLQRRIADSVRCVSRPDPAR